MKRHHILATAALVLACAATPATAQNGFTNQTASQPAQEATRFPNRRAHPFNEATIGTRTPRYLVEILSVHAERESGATNLGDDEISVLVRANNYWTVTERFEDFDNNETRLIAANQSCAFPARDTDGFNRSWGCDINGGANPGIIEIQVREHDEALIDPFDLRDMCILPDTLTSDLLSRPHECLEDTTYVGIYELDLNGFSSLQQGQAYETDVTMGGWPIGIYTVRYRVTRTYDIVDQNARPTLSQQ
ncbi:MAG: hypothetical protein JNL81_00840 [Hyphomonadaceae bacterium]|nr:hypothetical protein [Hyphomonadaceae bacterium]